MRISFLVVFAILSFSPGQAQTFRAGVSRIDITPQPGHVMGGYSARQGTATGTHDPLFATVLVLEGANSEKLAWITADLRSFVSTRVGEEIRKRFGIRHTLISVSHTHSGPLTWEARTAWYARAEDQMIAATGEAVKALEPATIAVATASVYLGFNRRKVGKDGVVTMQWRNEAKLPSHPVDPQVTVLAIQRQTQPANPLAILVHYACHPTILGPDNLLFSADYPGALRESLERTFPASKVAFIQGGAGDINPYRDKEPGPTAGFAAVQEAGQELAKVVTAAVRRAKPLPNESGALRISSEVAQIQNRWNPQSGRKIATGWSAVMLGNGAFCALTLPGEPFVEHQLAFREKAECASSILAGYTFTASLAEGAWVGYLPTITAAVEGGYGANYNTSAAVGTAELLVDRGVIRLFQIRGLLKELPENAW
jgi:neutral ceramidase